MSSLRKVIRKITNIKLEDEPTKKIVKRKTTVVADIKEPAKKIVKRKNTAATEIKDPTKKIVKRKNTYEYAKEGQKKKTPALNDPLRRFYTSLLRQKPYSPLAIKWCIEHGLLPGQHESIHNRLSKLTL